RISDLRAVENWLRMNLSMLSSTIQGLEVQRATISTLKSFMHSASPNGAAAAEAGPSPLEVVLGIKPGAQRDAPPEPAPNAEPEPRPKPHRAAAAAPAGPPQAAAAQAGAAAQGWWDMLQKQFDTLAAATAATLQNAEAARVAAQQFEQASSDSALGSTRASSTKAAAPARPANKAAKKAPARKRTPASRRKES